MRILILILLLMLMLVVTQRLAVERMEKLGEQLEEARKLRQSIFRRGDAVFAILSRYNPLSITSSSSPKQAFCISN